MLLDNHLYLDHQDCGFLNFKDLEGSRARPSLDFLTYVSLLRVLIFLTMNAVTIQLVGILLKILSLVQGECIYTILVILLQLGNLRRKKLPTMIVARNQTTSFVVRFIRCDRCALVMVGHLHDQDGVSQISGVASLTIWSRYANSKVLPLFISLEIDLFSQSVNCENLQSGTKSSGWLCY